MTIFTEDASVGISYEQFSLHRPGRWRLRGAEIFVVDDDELVRDAIAALLTPEGCNVTCFADGETFLVAGRSRTPSCVLLDINMPGRSGRDMLRELDAPRYPAPILIVSGQRDVPTAVSVIKAAHSILSRSRSTPPRSYRAHPEHHCSLDAPRSK